jgi:zinc/manganese transport system substrate-binding protein
MNFKKYFILLSIIFASPSWAQVNIFACEPEWASLAIELGGEHVKVFSATTGLQDPHKIQPRPSLMAKARQADMMICTGADLEVGWLPLLLRQVGNPRIQPDQPGYFIATDYVKLQEIPVHVNRLNGDVHALGNPHIQTNPYNIGVVAKALAQRLQQVDPEHANKYQTRYVDFKKRWDVAIDEWNIKAKPLRGTPIIVSHNSWIYMEDWLDLKRVTTLEPKPGIPASSAYLADVLKQTQTQKVDMIINAAYQDPRAADWLEDRSDITIVTLPFTVGGNAKSTDLFNLFDSTIELLLEAKQNGS